MALQGSISRAGFPRDPGTVADASAGAVSGEEEARFLRTGENTWRVERAGRAAVLVDGAAFFRAVREALLNAQRSVFVVGWDIDSRCRLVGENCEPSDGMPVLLTEFLSALVRKRPHLKVRLLLWDYSVVYAAEREPFPTLALHWTTPRQVQLCLDDALPVGSAQHQKIIVVDDAIAFSGGLDLTIRRWDTPEHRAENPDRVDPAGNSYRPFHDVQALVDGPAAQALSHLVRERWKRASGEECDPVAPNGDPWPVSVAPDFQDIDVGIARTVPLSAENDEVREVERLFFDSISRARRTIYIENQFFTCIKVARELAKVLQEKPDLEAVMVAPRYYDSWIETHTMRNGRIRFMRAIEEAGIGGRIRLFYPEVRSAERVTDTMIHSKICIIDDRFLRVGSANLNNRSMGADSECDLAFEARNETQRAQILRIRDRLLAEHCGVTLEEIQERMRETGSLVRTAELSAANGHRLLPIDDGEPDADELSATIEGVADPLRPLPSELAERNRNTWFAHLSMRTLAKVLFVAAALLLLPLIWQYTPLAAWTDAETARKTLNEVAAGRWAPLIVTAIFVVAGLFAFPVVVLIAVTAATFGPVQGLVFATMGSLASAIVSYLIGAWLGRELLHDLMGPRLNRIRRRIVDRGVLAVAVVRLMPIAPFTFINLVAGASQIRLQDYIAGTLLGMAPGLLVMSVLGHQLFQILTEPTLANTAALGGVIILWIAVSVGVQMLVSRMRRP